MSLIATLALSFTLVSAPFHVQTGGTQFTQNIKQTLDKSVVRDIQLDNANAREVLGRLFTEFNLHGWIDPEVVGNVSLSMKNVSLDFVLTNILKQLAAKYDIQGESIAITSSLAPQPTGLDAAFSVPRQACAMAADDSFVFELNGATLSKVDRATLDTLDKQPLTPLPSTQTLALNDPKNREKFQNLMMAYGFPVVIAPECSDSVNLNFSIGKFENMVNEICGGMKRSMNITNGVFRLYNFGSSNLQVVTLKIVSGTPIVPDSALTSDGDFLFARVGHWRFKVRKFDLRVEQSTPIGEPLIKKTS